MDGMTRKALREINRTYRRDVRRGSVRAAKVAERRYSLATADTDTDN